MISNRQLYDLRLSAVALSLLLIAGWAVPSHARAYVVNQKHAQASDAGAGTEASPYLTISKGAAMANAGDTVLVHAGIYRERVAPARGGSSSAYITYLAAPGDSVYIKGSEVWTPAWRQVSTDVYSAKPDPAMFGTYNPFRIALSGGLMLTLGQVFVNGRLMIQTPSRTTCLATAGMWCRDSVTDTLTVHFPAGVAPAQALVEISVRSRVFAPHTRGLGYIRVKGFVMEHCANQYCGDFEVVRANAQSGLIGCRSGNHWIIENNVIRHAKSIGVDIGDEGLDNEGTQPKPSGVGYHLIQGNIISDNGLCGICGMSSRQSRIMYNVIERNNVNEVEIVENSGFKVHNFQSGLVSGNIVRNNRSYGIWVDSDWSNARITRNLCYGNKDAGIFVELGIGPLTVDNNISVLNRTTGLFCRDGAAVTSVHNIFSRNSQFGEYLQKPDGRIIWGSQANVYNWKIFNTISYRNSGRDLQVEADPGVHSNTYGCNALTPGKQFRVDTTLTQTDTLVDSMRIDTLGLTMMIAVRDGFFSMGCTAFSGIDRDFPGNTMPTSRPLAGAFQNLSPGRNIVSLLIPGVPAQPVSVVNPAAAGLKSPRPRSPGSCAIVGRGTTVRLGPGARSVEVYTLRGERLGRFTPSEGDRAVRVNLRGPRTRIVAMRVSGR